MKWSLIVGIAVTLFFSSFSLIGVLALGPFPFLDSVVFESLESKNNIGGAVFNEVVLISKKNKDIWMMNQSHHGVEYSSEKWDRLAITVDKKTKVTRFYQLPPGELVWDDSLKDKAIDYKVSCFMCHPNGPRVIRPKDLNSLEGLKVMLWNLRIKSYGLLIEGNEQEILDQNALTPFRYRGSFDNKKLSVKACLECHNGGDGFFERSELTRQNAITIDFMLKNKLMPPLGHSLSRDEEHQIKKFLIGF